MPDHDGATTPRGASEALVSTFNASDGPPPRPPMNRKTRLNRHYNGERSARQARLDARLEQIVVEYIRRFKAGRC